MHRVVVCCGILLFAQGCSKTIEAKETESHITCNVDLSAPGGGRIEVSRFDPISMGFPMNKYQIIWHVPAYSPSIDLVVGYGSELVPLDKLKGGGHARFVIPNAAKDGKYSAEIDIEGGEKWVFSDADFSIGSDIGDLMIDKDTQRGQAIISAIDNKTKFKIIIFNDSVAFAASTFDPSETAERDFMYKQAKEFVETANPKYCHNY